MPEALSHDLEDRILTILQSEAKPLSLPQLEERLDKKYDTFDVLRAVRHLIRKGQADYTPRRYVTVVQ